MLYSVFILLVFSGWSYGLQAPLYYKYKYYGSVSNGIQELSSQASGWAMKAEVNVFVLKNDGEAVFQIQNVKMVEFATDLKCDSKGDLPEELFLDIENPSLRSAFEAPFKAHLFHSEDYAIEYSEDEFLWLINVRKGIVSIFRNEILYGNIENQVEYTISSSIHKGHAINVFSVMEETIFGKCSIHYTLHPIPDYMTGTKNRYLEEYYEQDVQRKIPESSAYTSKTSKKTSKTHTAKSPKIDPRKSTKTPSKYQRSDVPEIKDDLWHVVRSVDFDQCEEIVGLQANTFDATPMHGGQHDWRRSRSSVSEYIFRGSPGHFRLEKALVEGARTMAPYGVKTELLQSRINQTLQLVSVESLQVAPSLEGNIKHSNTWMFEFWSPASSPKESKAYPWVVYTGKGENFKISQIYGLNPPTEEERRLNWRDVIEYFTKPLTSLIEIKEEVLGYFPPFPYVGETVSSLKKAASLMKDMSKEEILKLFTLVEGEDWTEKKKMALNESKELHSYFEQLEHFQKKIIVEVAASSGLNHAYEAILDLAKEGKINRYDLMTFFMTLSSNANGPQIISSLMDYVTAFNIEDGKSTVSSHNIIINFANFLNKMCLSPQAKSQYYYGPLFGDEKCPVHLISDKFLPFLKNIIFNENMTYETDAAVMALGQLGGPYSYKLLSAIIREESMKFPIRTRVRAIESLDGRMFQAYNLRDVALNLLTEILTKIGEDVSLREAALHMIFTWGPDNQFFYQMARMSWRKPSRQFASLLTTMLESLANVVQPGFKQYAQVASHALKLAKPVAPSLKYSYIAALVSNLVDKHSASTIAIEWFTSDKSSLLKNLYLGVFSNLGGFEGNQIEAYIEIENLLKGLQAILAAEPWLYWTEEGNKEGIFMKVAQEFYDNVETYLKTTMGTGPDMNYLRSDLSLYLLQHMNLFITTEMNWTDFIAVDDPRQVNINFAKFNSPINVRSVDPTELGIPLSMEIFAPILVSLVGEAGHEENYNGSFTKFHAFFRFIEECHGSIEVLLPWSKKIARVQSSSVKEINLPININAIVYGKPSLRKKTNMLIEFYSPPGKVPLLRAASFPISSLVAMYPLRKNVQDKTLVLGPGYPPVSKTVHVPKHFTGLDLNLTWKSNLEFTYTKYKVQEMLNDPSSFLEAPFMPLSFITSTLQYWELYVEFDPSLSSTQTISFSFSKGTFGDDKPESFTQERGDFNQYGQKGFGQYDQEQEGIQQGFEEGFQDVKEANADIPYITYEDSRELRIEKLQNIYGGSGDFKSYKFTFSGSEYRSFEALFVSSKQKSDDGKRKSGVIFIRSPIPDVDNKSSLVCFNYESFSPSYKKLFNLKDLSADNFLYKSTMFDVTLECTGEPILILGGTYKISESWISKLQDEVPKYCDYDQFNDMFTLHSHAVYNDVQFVFDWKRVCDPKYPLTSKAIQLLENAADRFLSHKCQSSDGTHRTHIELSRCPVTGNWDINIHQIDLQKSFKNIPHNHIFSHLFTLGKKTSLELHPEIHSLFNWESESCVFGVDSVRTFDGYIYEYKPSQCWSVAVRSCEKHVLKKVLLLVRSPDTESTIPEVKYIDALEGIVVEYTRNNIRVNGKIIDPVDGKEILKDDKGRILLTIIKNDDYFMVKLPNDFYFSVKNRVTVHAPPHLAGSLCGLCGNFNGEPEDDLVGPHRCSYSDTNTFVASWTAKSDKCDLYTLLELREEAENYQKQCTVIEDEYKLGLTMPPECYYSSREVRELEDRICVTKNYHLHCTANCQAVEQLNKNETFLCWPKEHAPSSLSDEAHTEKSFVYYDLPEEPNTASYYVQDPTLCIPIR